MSSGNFKIMKCKNKNKNKKQPREIKYNRFCQYNNYHKKD